jgi:hypothetical protein
MIALTGVGIVTFVAARSAQLLLASASLKTWTTPDANTW